jgi:hypothetical protein
MTPVNLTGTIGCDLALQFAVTITSDGVTTPCDLRGSSAKLAFRENPEDEHAVVEITSEAGEIQIVQDDSGIGFATISAAKTAQLTPGLHYYYDLPFTLPGGQRPPPPFKGRAYFEPLIAK